jgi:predicted ABC-type exoprotein transport system permease subunit
MTAFQLFQQRFIQEWKFQSKLFFSVVDWVTGLYVVIPSLLIAGYHYIQLWQQSYTWPEELTPLVLLLGMFVWSLSGHIRFFIEEADQVLIRHHQHFFRSLRLYAVRYSLLRTVLGNGLLFLGLLPLLLQYLALSWWTVITLFLFTTVFRWLHLLLKTYAFLPAPFWKKNLLPIVVLLILCGAYVSLGLLTVQLDSSFSQMNSYTGIVGQLLWPIIVALALLLPLWILISRRLSLPWSFPYDCVYEQEKKLRFVGFMLQQAKHIGAPEFQQLGRKKQKRNRFKRVWLKRKMGQGKHLQAPELLVRSMFYRYVLRNKQKVMNISRLTGVCLTAIVLIPGWFKLGMWLMAIVLILFYFKSVWNEYIRHEYVKLFQWRHPITQRDAVRSIYLCSIPSVVITSFMLGTTLFSIWIGILAIFVGLIFSYGGSLLFDPDHGTTPVNR